MKHTETNNLLTASKQALETMRNAAYDEEGYTLNPDLAEAHDTLRTAIEQAEKQEPEIPDCGEAGHAEGCCGNRECLPSFRRTKSAAQRQWVGLTDEERKRCTRSPFTIYNYLAIEAKLREKNGL